MTDEQLQKAITPLRSSTKTEKINLILSNGLSRMMVIQQGQKITFEDGLLSYGSIEAGDFTVIEMVSIQAVVMVSKATD